jgi:antitoxin CptB
MPDTDEIRRKRLLFRSRHRGTKESDLLLGAFADTHLAGFSEAEVAAYESLLEVDDPELWDWILDRAETPPEHHRSMLHRLKTFRYTGSL